MPKNNYGAKAPFKMKSSPAKFGNLSGALGMGVDPVSGVFVKPVDEAATESEEGGNLGDYAKKAMPNVDLSFIRPFGDIEAGWWGMGSGDEARQRGYVKNMDASLAELVEIHQRDPDEAQAIARSMQMLMHNSGYEDFDAAGGPFLWIGSMARGIVGGADLADQMQDAREQYYFTIAKMSMGSDFHSELANYQAQYKEVGMNNPPLGAPRKRRTQRP